MFIIKAKYIVTIFFLFGMLLVLPNSLAQQPDDIKTIEQMNARLDFLYGSHDVYHHFFDQLKRDIAQGNKSAVAAVVKYPLKINIKEKRIIIKNQQQFIKNYNVIITEKIKIIVAEERFVGMFANWSGMMFGNGQIWFSGICLDKTCKDSKKLVVRIIAINI